MGFTIAHQRSILNIQRPVGEISGFFLIVSLAYTVGRCQRNDLATWYNTRTHSRMPRNNKNNGKLLLPGARNSARSPRSYNHANTCELKLFFKPQYHLSMFFAFCASSPAPRKTARLASAVKALLYGVKNDQVPPTPPPPPGLIKLTQYCLYIDTD